MFLLVNESLSGWSCLTRRSWPGFLQPGSKERMVFNATPDCRKRYRTGNTPDTSARKSY